MVVGPQRRVRRLAGPRSSPPAMLRDRARARGARAAPSPRWTAGRLRRLPWRSGSSSSTYSTSRSNSRASRRMIGSRSRNRLLMCSAITPSSDSLLTYSASASRVIRCIGIESLEKASTTSTSNDAVGLAHQAQAPVADHRLHRGARIPQVAEVALRDRQHARVDLEESVGVARLAVGRERAGAEADEAHLQLRSSSDLSSRPTPELSA